MVLVAYRDTMRLRIPITSTNLVATHSHLPRTKWTEEAIHELLSLVTEGESSCHIPRASGPDSRNP